MSKTRYTLAAEAADVTVKYYNMLESRHIRTRPRHANGDALARKLRGESFRVVQFIRHEQKQTAT